MTYPELRQSRCTRYRFRYSECRRCADTCPHDAISLTEEGAKLDMARCRDCGLCSSACRAGAWECLAVPRLELLRRAIQQEEWSFACAPSGAAADAVVPCLGALDAPMLAYLGKRGIPVELRGTGHCAQCDHGERGPAMVDVHLDAVERLRETSGETWARITVAEASEGADSGPHAFDPGRRQIFRRLLGGVETEARRAVVPEAFAEAAPEKAIRAARSFVTEQRELLQIVTRRRDGAPFPYHMHEALPLADIALAEGCTACEACFRACPSGALQVRESETTWTLAFIKDRCMACGVCLEVCQPHVLRARPEFDIAPGGGDTVLHELGRQRCGRCDRVFTSPKPRPSCGVCTDDEQAFDTIFGGPEQEEGPGHAVGLLS